MRAPPPTRPPPRPGPAWPVLVGAWLTLTALTSAQVVLSATAMGTPLDRSFAWVRLAETAMLAVYLPAVYALRRLVPPERVGVPRHLAVTLLALVPVVAAALPAALALAGAVTPGRIVFRGSHAAKAITEYLTLAVSVVLAAMYELHARLRERETHALQLEARLAEARLQALASQLHPHFLFNTLTAVSVLVHRDPDAADTMLTRLADLLRATLRRPSEHEIPLAEELALLGRYVDIMRVRYGARLAVDTRVPTALGALLVPPFVLQPLVENAIEHGVARRAGPGTVTVTAARDGGRLRLTVADDGPGLAPDARRAREDGDGVGLPNTRRRLEQLYGDAQRLTLEHEPGVGTRAVVELPAREAGPSG